MKNLLISSVNFFSTSLFLSILASKETIKRMKNIKRKNVEWNDRTKNQALSRLYVQSIVNK